MPVAPRRCLVAAALFLLPRGGLAEPLLEPIPAPATRPSTSANDNTAALQQEQPQQAQPLQQVRPVPAPGQPLPRSVLAARLRGAMVRCENPHLSDLGHLVGDRRTVLLPAMGPYDGRPFLVRPWNQEGPIARSVRVELVRAPATTRTAYLVHLDRDLPLTPLELARQTPRLGEAIYLQLPGQPEDRPVDLLQTTTVGVAESTLAVGAPVGTGVVLDGEGRLVGLQVGGQQVLLASRARNLAVPSPRTPVLPLFGLRLGYEHGGLLDRAFVLSVEVGASLWDRLGLLLRCGLGVGSQGMSTLAGPEGLGTGVASGGKLKLDLALEARYRLLLASRHMIYLELGAGVQLSHGGQLFNGVALFASQPGCDPTGETCPLVARDASQIASARTSVAPSFGADLRLGVLVLGYRFLPGALAYRQPNAHLITLGVLAL